MTTLLELPEDVWRNVASYLAPPNLLQFLSSHRRFHERLGQSAEFWKFLLHQEEHFDNHHNGDPRQHYMIQSYRNALPAVRWIHLENDRLSKREGHLSCVFSTRHEDLICITGGFTVDPFFYLMRVDHVTSRWEWARAIRREGRDTTIYGATLTTLDEFRAVRFGGFRAGGYSQETNQVVLLQRSPGPGSSHIFEWQPIVTQNSELCTPRAYHTATLIGGRYLLALGGMTSSGCIIRPSILDTETWTWLSSVRITNVPIVATASDETGNEPTGRHGHSVILDASRNRLVLFGGGTGSDLLHSGEDNTEVWELQMGTGWETDLEESFPWTWRQIHQDSNDDEFESNVLGTNDNRQERHHQSSLGAAGLGVADESSSSTAEALGNMNRENILSPAEALCLGRCHVGVRVSPDMALLVCGSGRPSTNRVLAYNLAKDSFHRPKALGSLPTPRFSFVTAFVERQGYILVHGGYSSQEEDALGDMAVLDLAPYVQKRDFATWHYDHVTSPPCYGPVLDNDARNGRMSSQIFFRQLFNSSLVNDQQRQTLAAEFVEYLTSSGQYGGRFFTRLNMVADGNVFVTARDEDDDDDDSYQEDEEEGDNDDEEHDNDDSEYQEESDNSMGNESEDSLDS